MFGLAVVALLFITPSAHAAIFNCNPADVASWGNRVHVRCSPSAGVIAFFAVNTTNPGATERFTEIALAALVNNKTLAIEFNPADASGPSFGCALSNCRPALAIVIVK
jgi:hypothetical protein